MESLQKILDELVEEDNDRYEMLSPEDQIHANKLWSDECYPRTDK